MSSLTALCLGTGMRVGTGISNPLLWLGAFILSAAVYAFIFDDFLEWRARKGDVWVLTNMHLVYFNPNDETSPAAVPLSAIETVSGWMFWGVRVRLVPRDQLMMLFLADRTTVRDTIRAHLPPKETTK
ncbi:hypothetical protein [Shimia abyssi]|uniref:hypothetical protein n=1 Tax=Shimia abyssi TaxID=1662395 RepID=UPI00105701E1|nr:hypothetical protein [Shimia abyssi]